MKKLHDYLEEQVQCGGRCYLEEFDPQRDWLIVDGIRSSLYAGLVDRANMEAAKAMLCAAGGPECYEEQYFADYGAGWYSLLTVDHDCADAVEVALEIEKILSERLIISSDLYSAMMYNDACDAWRAYAPADRAQYLKEHKCIPTDYGVLYRMMHGVGLPDDVSGLVKN